jgi:purine-binding chemotaxis protein CheW
MKFGLFSRLPGGGHRDAERKLVEFEIGGVRYGADIMRVREIVNPRRVIPIPSAPPYVVGVADHRSTVVPVVDLRRRFGLDAETSERAKWVIVDTRGMDTALLVDKVNGVTPVDRSEQRDAHPLTDVAQSSWVQEVFGSSGGLVFELDLDAVVGEAVEVEPGGAPGEAP